MTLIEILEATDRLQLSDKLILLERISQLIRQELEPMFSQTVTHHALNFLEKEEASKTIHGAEALLKQDLLDLFGTEPDAQDIPRKRIET